MREIKNKNTADSNQAIDQELSNRFIALDPKGYFLIKLDFESEYLVVEHYSNDIDESGKATDPQTGEPLKCSGGESRTPLKIYKGRTAKELGIKLTEGDGPHPISFLDHALYLGRELQRAEACLLGKNTYIQD